MCSHCTRLTVGLTRQESGARCWAGLLLVRAVPGL